jgi:hypothetical protein
LSGQRKGGFRVTSISFTMRSDFPADASAVVDALLDVDLQAELHRAPHYVDWEEISREERGSGELARELALTPPIELPGFIRRAFGNSAGYREVQNWEPGRRGYAWRVTFRISRSLELAGTCRFTDHLGGSHRDLEARCTVSIPVVGKRVAAYVREETLRNQRELMQALATRLAGG